MNYLVVAEWRGSTQEGRHQEWKEAFSKREADEIYTELSSHPSVKRVMMFECKLQKEHRWQPYPVIGHTMEVDGQKQGCEASSSQQYAQPVDAGPRE